MLPRPIVEIGRGLGFIREGHRSNQMVPENASYYEHITEGADDIPAHLKNSILGSSVTIPIKNHRLHLGTWQGLYLCEHRNNGGQRKLVVTINGN